MQDHTHGAYRRMTAIVLALFCSTVLSAAPAAANPSYTFKTVVTTDLNNTLGAFAGLGVASINDAGVVAFYGSVYCGALNPCAVVYTVDPAGTLTKIIQGNPILNFPYPLYSEAVINHGGAVSFNVQIFTPALPLVTGNATSNWLGLWKGGVVKQAAPTRAVTPPAPTVYVGPRLLNNSKIIVSDAENHTLVTALKGKPPQPAAPGYCNTSNGTGSSLNGLVVTQGGPVGAGACVNTGFLVTNIPKGTTQLRVANDGTYGQLNNATVNQSGAIAFSTRNLPGRTNVEGFFQQKAGGPVVKLAELDNGTCANAPPASGSCQYRAYSNSLAISQKGQAVANVFITNWTSAGIGPMSVISGVTLNGDAVNGQIVWPGMVIDGCDVRQAQAGPRSINKYGQIAIQALCNQPGGKTSVALIVATPAVR